MVILRYERIDVSEGTNINKTSASKTFIIFHCWYFLSKGIFSSFNNLYAMAAMKY